jgi:hypothetical protein
MLGFGPDRYWKIVRTSRELFDPQSNVNDLTLSPLGHNHADEVSVISKVISYHGPETMCGMSRVV